MEITINAKGTLCLIVQVLLVILKACFVEPFNSLEWSCPLLWIPLMIYGCLMFISFILVIVAIFLDRI